MRPVTSSVPGVNRIIPRVGADARLLRQLVDEGRAGELENYTPLERIAVMHLLEERLAEEKEPAAIRSWLLLLGLLVGSIAFWGSWAFFLVRFMT